MKFYNVSSNIIKQNDNLKKIRIWAKSNDYKVTGFILFSIKQNKLFRKTLAEFYVYSDHISFTQIFLLGKEWNDFIKKLKQFEKKHKILIEVNT